MKPIAKNRAGPQGELVFQTRTLPIHFASPLFKENFMKIPTLVKKGAQAMRHSEKYREK